MNDGWCHLFASNPENTLRLLIELPGTKLGERFVDICPADDDLELERLAPLLDPRLGCDGETFGWSYGHPPLTLLLLAALTHPFQQG